MSDYRIEVMKLADGWWVWRIVTDQHRILEKGNQSRRTRSGAVRAARKRLKHLQRTWAQKWEDA